MKKLLTLVALVYSLAGCTGPTSQPTTEQVRERLVGSTGGNIRIQTVQATAVPGVYEVLADGEVFYTDSSARYAWLGARMMDLKTRTDLTAAAQDTAGMIAFDELPLSLSITEVKGSGRRKIALFEDPGCPSCRVLHKLVAQLDDVTIYHFMYPIIDPDNSIIKTRITWCAPKENQVDAWNSFMSGNDYAGSADCDTSELVKVMEFGKANNMQNTPTIIMGSGRRIIGVPSPETLIKELEKS